tara:strand:- start:624 stop:3059 length:2436 start_codon:yes stop_codon:yes gene_type:complete
MAKKPLTIEQLTDKLQKSNKEMMSNIAKSMPEGSSEQIKKMQDRYFEKQAKAEHESRAEATKERVKAADEIRTAEIKANLQSKQTLSDAVAESMAKSMVTAEKSEKKNAKGMKALFFSAKNMFKKSPEDALEEKSRMKNLFGGITSLFKSKKDKEGGLMDGIKKMMGKYKKIIMSLLGVGLVALFSQLNMEQVKKMWEALKTALVAVYEFILPIVKTIWGWAKNTLLPTLVDYVVATFNNIAELFTSIKERFDGWSGMSWKEKIFAILGVFSDIGKFVWKQVGNLLEAAEKLLGGDGSFTKDLWGNLTKFFTGLIDWFILLFTDPTAALGQLWDGLWGGIKSIGSWIYEKALAPIGRWFKEIWTNITKPISDKWNELFPDGIAGSITGIFTDIKDYFANLFDFSGSWSEKLEKAVTLYFLPWQILKDKLFNPIIKWLGEKFGFDTKAFTDFSIGELFGKAMRSIINWFNKVFDIDLGKIIRNMAGKLGDAGAWLLDKVGFGGKKDAVVEEPPAEKKPTTPRQKFLLQAIEQQKKELKEGDTHQGFDAEGWTQGTSRKDIIATLEKRLAKMGYVAPKGPAGVTAPLGDKLAQLKKDEGFRSSVYEDTEGIKTVGYGFNLERGGAQEALDASGIKKSLADLKSGKESLTEEEASKLMGDEYGQYAAAAKRFVNKGKDGTWKNLSQDRQRVITNMAYNIGEGSLSKFSKLRKAIQDGDYEEAGAQMSSSKWAGQVKGRSTRLVARMTDNTSGIQLASLQGQSNELSGAGSTGAGNTTLVNKGGDVNNSSNYTIGQDANNPRNKENHPGVTTTTV